MIIKCKMCGGDLHPAENATTCECEYCGSVQTIPKLDNERRANLYDRANHFRRSNDYDKAMGIFEQILQDDRTDAEAYWSLVLCRYGIEYVEDPATHKRVPTVNRVQFTSILADEDYKSALEYADAVQRGIYEQEAKTIDALQKGILEISKKEKPFDVFICYKETDAEGRRTPDSVLANDLYHQLTREGFKVFFSRITLEDKLGQQYEPYIFAALNSAKVMVVLGTKPEYFSAVWVKNEWSRYLSLIKSGANKTLVPAYKDMDPYDLPEEFSHLQAQDMSKLGFMQDLIHGIKKLTGENQPNAAQQVVVQQVEAPLKANVQSLIGRAFMALEDSEWEKADDFCEQALNQDFQNARAYMGKLMAEMRICRESDLPRSALPLEKSGNYQKALRFADEALKKQLTDANDAVKQRKAQAEMQKTYQLAMAQLHDAATVEEVCHIRAQVEKLHGYADAAKGISACDAKIEDLRRAAYQSANGLMKQEKYAQAAAAFRKLGDYRDSKTAAAKCDELEKELTARLAAERAEQNRLAAERAAKEAAERAEKERIAAENRAREEEIRRREAKMHAAKVRRVCLILGLIAALCAAGFFVVTKVILPKMDYDHAVQLLEAGQYDEAYSAFAALGDYEDCGDRLLQVRANKAFDAGQYDAAGSIYATLPAAYQDHAADFAALYNAAKAKLEAGNYDDAIDAFTALGNYSDSRTQIQEATYRKACQLAENGERDTAAALLASMHGYKDSQARIAQMQADILFERGDYAEAWDVYAGLLEVYQTHNAEYADFYAAAQQLLENGMYDGAARAFAALGSYQDSAEMVSECSYRKAESLASAGSYADAIALYEQLGDYRDSAALAKQTRADQLYAEGAYADAYAIYAVLDAQYQTHADDYAAMYTAAAALQDAARYDEAIAAFTGITFYGDSSERILECRYLKAGALASAASYADAIAIYQQLGAYRDSSLLATQAQADAHYDADEYAEAYAIYANLPEAYQPHAADYEAMYAAAESSRASGNYDAAYDQFATLGDYRDAKEQAVRCGREKADMLYAAEQYGEAAEVYAFIGDTDKVNDAVYHDAGQLAAQGEYLLAAKKYESIMNYGDSEEQHYQAGLQARDSGKLADALEILLADPDYRDTKEAIYQTGTAASAEKLYTVSVPAFTHVGAYKDAAMKLTMDTYAWGGQLYEQGDYDQSADVFASMGQFSDAPARAQEARYAAADDAEQSGAYDDAAARFKALGSYSNSAERADAAAYAAAKKRLDAGDYADAKQRFTALGKYSDSAEMAKESDYRPAMDKFRAGDYAGAKAAFSALGGYKDSAAMAQECDYIPAKAIYDAGQYSAALNALAASSLNGYKDVEALKNECRYQLGKAEMANRNYEAAAAYFDAAGSYKSSESKAAECRRQIALGKARTLEANADYESAYEQYKSAGETSKMAEMAYQAGLAKLAQSDYPNAISWLETAGDYSDAKEQILSIGEYYYATQQYPLAEAVYVKVAEVGAAAQRLYELGQYYERLGDVATAARVYGEAGEYANAQEKATAMQREADYQTAEALYKQQDWEGAKAIYETIRGYKETDARLAACNNEINYQTAEALYKRKDWKGAKAVYVNIRGFKDADSKIKSCDNEIAAAAVAACDAKFAVGNYVTFGRYPQTKAGKDKTPIEWLVLARDGSKALLISRYALDAKPYNTSYTSVTWETCTLRKWLNSTFINKAFNAAEQAAILKTSVDNGEKQGYNRWNTSGGNNTQDKVFLLSYAEANKCFDVEYWQNTGATENVKSRVAPTAYALAQGADTSSSQKTADGTAAWWWWLRSPGGSQDVAVHVDTTGALGWNHVNSESGSVRPALWVNLESGIF